jgi:hypothetical protein
LAGSFLSPSIDSTSSSKRRPLAVIAGKLATTPTTSTSRPSSSGARRSIMRQCAQPAAHKNPMPNVKTKAHFGLSHARTARTGTSAIHAIAGSAACCCSAAAPAANASAARVI